MDQLKFERPPLKFQETPSLIVLPIVSLHRLALGSTIGLKDFKKYLNVLNLQSVRFEPVQRLAHEAGIFCFLSFN